MVHGRKLLVLASLHFYIFIYFIYIFIYSCLFFLFVSLLPKLYLLPFTPYYSLFVSFKGTLNMIQNQLGGDDDEDTNTIYTHNRMLRWASFSLRFGQNSIWSETNE